MAKTEKPRIKLPPGYNVTDPSKPRVYLRQSKFTAQFVYKTREHAQQQLIANARRSGITTRALTVLEQDGRFAIVPAWRKGMPIPQFQKGEIVFGLYMCDSEAKVVEPGKEQSIIRFVKESTVKARPKEMCVPNYHLWKPSEVAKGASTRERL
jgi:hypothetical protein